jgi:proteasome lid subunit RPN8/RPN11
VPRTVVTPAVRDRLHAHAREGADDDPPREVCGVLAGVWPGEPDEPGRVDDAGDRQAVRDGRGAAGGTGGGPVEVRWTRRVANVAPSPASRYELDPAAALSAIEAATAAGLDHVGFYHSHPTGPAVPSATDRAEARWPGALYCIVTPGGEVAAWEWAGESFRRCTVEVGGPA